MPRASNQGIGQANGEGRGSLAANEHRAIVRAMERKDVIGARKVMEQHFVTVIDILREKQ
ncbi:FCD domain-containing protein [Candidatus Bipolaricaulota bacterium]|nr:FCD domain-containing protein [Candidatus Bipolaricaulota bacterium]